MAAPEFPRTRFYYRKSDGRWLLMMDTESPMTIGEAERIQSANYGFDVGIVEVKNLPYAQVMDILRPARHWGGAPPSPPYVDYNAPERLSPPSPSPSATAYDVFLSHSSSDDALAGDVKKLLEANGIRVFATPESIPTGSWEPQIEVALGSSSSVWVLLTPNALRESVWTHHEFGYFYGYNHGKGRDPQGHHCRFLYTQGTELRGLYAWIQGTHINSFEDPVPVAETIAKGIGVGFGLPGDWVPRFYPQQLAGIFRHPAIGPVGFSSSGLIHGPGTAQVTIELREIDETIYYVAGLTTHPDVELTAVTTADVIGPSYHGSVMLRLQYRGQPLDPLPEELTDARGRRFSVLPGPRAPQGKAPLLITFETEDRRALAAIFYYTISRHSKGFPELHLHAGVPMEWRQGESPSERQ